MTEWEEIKRLAADFQRTQTSDTLQRISERNCIDIIKKLTDLNLIELIYTCDGKEFITPAHLRKEIEDEIYVNGGRMQIHDLASNLNVDYNHIEYVAKELVRENPNEYNFILGQIIHSTYKANLGKQIQDIMMLTGQLSIAEFAKSLDLPSEFLLTIVKELLPIVMEDFVASQDERTYYTSDMMDRYKSIIAGTLSAISKPTSIASLMKRLDIPERIFVPIVDGLIKEGRIDASVENRLFIPAIYAREQNEWISKFYASNSYIEFDVLARMDIKQPKAFLRKRFPDGFPLKTCFVSPDLMSQVESLIEECIASNGWIDISSIIPSAIEADDIDQLVQEIFKKNKQFSSSCLVLNQVNVCSLGFIATCKDSFKDSMQERAQEHLKDGKLINYFLGGKMKDIKPRESVKEREKREQETNTPATNHSSQEEKENPDSVDKKDVKSPQVGFEEDSLTSAKDTKRDKKSKKLDDFDDSDDELSSKKSKSRKSGGGSQGREIKQKSVKKKYFVGNKSSQRNNDNSDDDDMPSKTPRSNKGRAARRAISPERTPMSSKSKSSQQKEVPEQKEPLVFMDEDAIINQLRHQLRSSGDASDEMFESIAEMIMDDLNSSYESLAKKTLDEYMKTQAEKAENDPNNAGEIDVVE